MSDARAVYNAAKSGVLWQVADLPSPLCTLDPASPAFADAVAAMQAVRGLAADGKLGPATLAAITPSHPAKLIAVAHAEANANVREVGGKNRGPRVEQYQRCVKLGPGDPWCAAFVAWCVMESMGTAAPPRWCSGSAVTTWHKGRVMVAPAQRVTPDDAGYALRVEPGWIWIRSVDKASAIAARKGTWSIGHCGIVVAVDAAGFHTVEGNTNAAGSREGDGVYRKFHRWDDAAQIARTVGWFDGIAAMEATHVSANA